MIKRHYSLIYRIIHWSIAICFILLLITIFLRLNWMNKEHVARIIRNYMDATGHELSQEESIVLAKQIRKPMWDWHVYTGYLLTGLYALRMMLPLFGKMKFSSPFSKTISRGEKFTYAVYLVFYACVAVSLVTGLLIEFGPKHIKAATESVHKLSVYYLIAFMILHLGGVFIAEFGRHKGIISAIISGNKKE
jgi:cytochrome b561